MADAAQIFRDLLTRFYQAYARKDLPAVEALWHPRGPAHYGRNVIEMEFELKTATLLSLTITEASITPAGGRARALIDLSVEDAKTKRVRRERRIREVTFLEDGGTWKIWNDGAGGIGMQVAARLLAASPEERTALIATDPEVRSDDTLAALALHANRLRSQGELAAVLDALSARAALARALDDESILAASLLDSGLVYQVLGRPEEAARDYTAARALFVKTGRTSEVAIVDSNLASVDYVRGDYASAAGRFRAALGAFEREGDQPRIASALHGLGNALYMQGDFEPAMACYQRCLALHEASGDKYSASSVLQAIALVQKEIGSYAAAIDAYERSAALSAAVEDHVGRARAEHGLGDTHRLLGDYSRALQHFGASLAEWEKTADAPSRAATVYAVGQVYALQRNYPRAIESYQQALDIDQKAGESAGIARDLGGLGGAHFGGGQLKLALDEYQKSLALREQLKDDSGVMWTHAHIGVLQTALAQHSEALQSYEQALNIAEAAGDAAAACTVLALRAANELARDDVEAALASSVKAATAAERLEMFDVLANARLTAGKAHRKAGRVKEAIASLQESVAALERVPVGPGVETFFDDRRSPYLVLVDLLASEKDAQPSRVPDALGWWERARTRNLSALFGGDGAAIVKGLTKAEREEELRLGRTTRTLAVRLKRERARAKPDPDRIASVAGDLERAQDEQAAFRRSLFQAHPGLPVLRAQSEPVPLDAAGRVLDASEALVSFVVLEQKTHAFVVTGAPRGGSVVNVATIDVAASDLAASVAAFRDGVSRRQPRTAEAGRQLYDLLVAPLRGWLHGTKSVVVVPDASLWSLPFEALQDARRRYLVQDLAVSYAPSLTALAAMRSVPAPADAKNRALVALADPVITAAALERLALVRAPAAPAFPPAGREVRGLTLAFGSQATQVLTKERARIDRLPPVRPGSALHLGVPGCLLDSSPLYSVLALSPSGPDDPDQGLLEAGDALSWTLPAGVVTLSRIESVPAMGNGDALAALAWSFHVAGAPSLVANRWLPRDGEPRILSLFYRAWLARAAGAPVPAAVAAMQSAARTLIAQPGSQPADWAGFMVLGR